MSHCLQDYGVSDYQETTYDYEFERPALDLEDDVEDTLEVSDGGGFAGGRGLGVVMVVVPRYSTD